MLLLNIIPESEREWENMNNEAIDRFREGIPIVNEKIYLDHAAMSPLHTDVVNRIHDFHLERQKDGPDFPKWWNLIEETRSLVAEWLHVQPSEIAFLWNTSAGINLAAQGFLLSEGDEVIIPDKEFPSNVYPWLALQQECGVIVKTVPFTDNRLTVDHIIASVTSKTKVISVSWVSATNGNMIDIQRLGDFCKENNILFVVDAIQGFCSRELDLSQIHVDVLVSGFYKWAMGPDGVSFVYVNKHTMNKMRIPWVGWASMEAPFEYEKIDFHLSKDARRYETGNMNFSAIAGVHETLSVLLPWKQYINERVQKLTQRLRSGLKTIPHVTLLSPEDSISGITLFQGGNLEHFTKHHVMVNYRSGIRVSPHFYNTEEEIDKFLNYM